MNLPTVVRRVAVLFATTALAGGLSVSSADAASGGATGQAFVTPGVAYEIVAYTASIGGGSKCSDVPGGTGSVGARLQIFHCHGYDRQGGPQRFYIDDMENGFFMIRNRDTQKCWNLLDNSGLDNTPIIQDNCVGAWASEQWQMQPLFAGTYAFRNRLLPNLCLRWADANNDGLPADDDRLVGTTCRPPTAPNDYSGNFAQVWWLG
jgi:hypothetical protein